MTALQISRLFCFVLALPLFAAGGVLLSRPSGAGAALLRTLPRWKNTGRILTAVACLMTAYELDTIGIDVFDSYLKIFPGEPYVLGAILAVLVCAWMPDLLTLRAIAAISMLYPAQMFRWTRLVESDWRLVPVSWAYVTIVFGMYAMFYPWYVRHAMAWIAGNRTRTILAGIAFCAVGTALVLAGIFMHS